LISERSCDTEDLSNDAENPALHHIITYTHFSLRLSFSHLTLTGALLFLACVVCIIYPPLFYMQVPLLVSQLSLF